MLSQERNKYISTLIVNDDNESRNLQESEKKYRELIEAAPDAIFVADAETGRIIDTNKKAEELLARTRKEILRMHQVELHPKEDADKYIAVFKEHVKRGEGSTVDLFVVNKYGEKIPVSVSAKVLEIAGRKIIQGVFRDITERKRAEESLRRSEERLSAFINSATDALTIWDSELNLVELNQAALKYLPPGIEKKDVIGKNLQVLEPKSKESGRLEQFFNVIKTGEPLSTVDLVLHLWSGDKVSESYLNVRAFKVNDGLGIMTTDITERKQMEKTLRETRDYLENLLDYANAPIIVWDSQFCITRFNHAFENITGRKSADVIGKSLEMLFPDNQLKGPMELIRRTFAGERWETVEIDIMHISGSIRTLLWNSATLYAPDGKTPIAAIAQGQDITERKLAEEEKRRLEDQLRQSQKMEAIGMLAGGVAHDFNNLLNVILGYSEIVIGNLHHGDPLRKEVKEIIKAGQRSAALTSQLLAFSRKQILQPEVLDINALLKNLMKMLHRLIGEDIDLKLVEAGDLAFVKVDHVQIEQVIINLAVNARDAMPQGGKLTIETANVELDELYVQTHAEVVPGKYVMIALTDTGCGMDKAILSKIFEPFFTTKEKGKGTGLGLASVYGIVKQSGGNIAVFSEQEKGTIFKIYLPHTYAKPDVKEVRPAEIRRRGSYCKSILVVEDEEALRGFFKKALRKLGYKVTVAANGDEALVLVEEKGLVPDLVITDVIMPNMGGMALAKRLRKNRPGVKVLYMSGYTDSAIEINGVIDPDTPFIQKPFLIKDLDAKIEQVIWNDPSAGSLRSAQD